MEDNIYTDSTDQRRSFSTSPSKSDRGSFEEAPEAPPDGQACCSVS